MTDSPRYDADALLSELAWVRRLARRLVGQDADDLVQDTWAQAMARPPRRDRPLRPWLATVARRLASNARRSRKHRTDRETVRATEARSTAPSAAELVERGEAQREVVDAVLGLDEPYRSVLLLRYFEGRTLKEIAQATGVSESTARTQASRGVERLRGRLDHSFDGDRARWMQALTPLTLGGVGGALEPSSAATEAAASKSLLTSVLSQFALMSTTVKLAALALPLVVLATWFMQRESGAIDGPSLASRQQVNEADLAAPNDLASADGAAAITTDAARENIAPAAADDADDTFVLVVKDRENGAPVPYWSFREATPNPREIEPSLGEVTHTTDAEGRVVLDSPVSSIVDVDSFESRERMHRRFRPNSGPGLPSPVTPEWNDGEAELRVDAGPLFWIDLGLPSGVSKDDVLTFLNTSKTPGTWSARPSMVRECDRGTFVRFGPRRAEPQHNVWLHAVTLDGRFGASVRADEALATDRRIALTLKPRCVVVVDLETHGTRSVEHVESFLFDGARTLEDVEVPYVERIEPMSEPDGSDPSRVRLRYDAIAPGPHTLTIIAKGFDTVTLPLELEPGLTERTVTLAARPMDARITGTITSATRSFHESLVVYAQPVEARIGDNPASTRVEWNRADEVWTGTFVIEELEDVPHHLWIYREDEHRNPIAAVGLVPRGPIEVTPGTPFELELTDDFETRDLTIRAIDAEDESTIEAFFAGIGNMESREWWSGDAFDGETTIESIRWEGELTLTVSAPEYKRATVTYAEDEFEPTVTVKLERGWSGDVMVHDEKQQPIIGADVLVDGTRIDSTGEHGHLAIDLDAAPNRVEVRHAGWVTKERSGVDADGVLEGHSSRSGSVLQFVMTQDR